MTREDSSVKPQPAPEHYALALRQLGHADPTTPTRLAEAVEAAGFASFKAFSDAVGISYSKCRRLAAGDREVVDENGYTQDVLAISALLKLPPVELFGEERTDPLHCLRRPAHRSSLKHPAVHVYSSVIAV